MGWILARRRGLAWVTAGLLAAAGASLVLTLAKTAAPVALSPLVVLAAGLLAALTLGGARALVPVRDAALLARVADSALALQDRMSTALDLAHGRIRPTALAPLTLADAARVARQAAALPLSPALPVRPPGNARRALVACAVALAAGLVVPGLTLPGTPARETAERIQEEGRRLERAGRRLEQQARTARVPEARRAAPQIQALGRQLQRERLERSEALSRLARLSRQLEDTRRRLEARTGGASPRPQTSTPEALARQSQVLTRQIQQLRELAARLAQEDLGEARRELAERLGELAQAGEGDGAMPLETRRKVADAARQVQQGAFSAAEEHLTDALQELEGLRAVLADQEALARAQRDLEAAGARITGGGDAAREPGAEERQAQPGGPVPGSRRPEDVSEPTGAEPGEGPQEGARPGQGRPDGKLGEETTRLGASKERTRVRGREGADGGVNVSEVLGEGRRGPSEAPVVEVPPLVVRRVDEAMVRLRVPPELRAVVRRYFEKLAGR